MRNATSEERVKLSSHPDVEISSKKTNVDQFHPSVKLTRHHPLEPGDVVREDQQRPRLVSTAQLYFVEAFHISRSDPTVSDISVKLIVSDDV